MNSNTENEVWKDVLGYEGRYKISSFGRVRSLDREFLRSDGVITSIKGKTRKTHINDDGYLVVGLRDGKREIKWKIHRLVVINFIPNSENKETVNHIDGNKQNNTPNNLEWATRLENSRHAWKTGLSKIYDHQRGEGSHHSKLSEERVRELRESYSTGDYSLIDLAKKYLVCKSTVARIIKRESWKHVI